ncbi:MAG: AbrB/MazE/SpoVT family DNA-binding domain-containing protein [Lachnospiraceae bacterium]|jgi:AbrB family looped-hinge helix DNA binding protein|nr:AbrB/MazE/SpoVT family DNA-binding domain-containing protein [Lachnospiraceae bacterium]
MKEKGVVRHLDTLGRVVIPKEFRTQYGIRNGDSVEIFNTNHGILVKKYKVEEDPVDMLDSITEQLYSSDNKEVAEQLALHIQEIKNILAGR